MYNKILKAIYLGNLNAVCNIIDHMETNWLITWKDGPQLVYQAIVHRRLDIAKILIKRCWIGNIEDDRLSLYCDAMLFGDVELVELLLDKNPKSLNKKSHDGDTLLHLAVSENKECMVKILLDRGADVNVRGSDGLLPINKAVIRGSLTILKLLLDSGASVNSKSWPTGKTSLLYAVETGNKDVVKLLLKNGANCNVAQFKGNTTLHCAIERGHIKIIKILLAAGADLNQRNRIGQTPLHVACMLKNRPLIDMFLLAGADINSTDDNGMVPCQAIEKRIVSSFVFVESSVSFFLIKHLILRKEGGFFLNNKNKILIAMIMNTYCAAEHSANGLLQYTAMQCQREIHLLKRFKSNNLTCYDVLKKIDNPLSVATEAELSVLQSAVKLNEFSMYEVLLETHLKYAKVRNSLLPQAQQFFSVVITRSANKLPPIPEEITRYILSFLNNYELNMLICNIYELEEAM